MSRKAILGKSQEHWEIDFDKKALRVKGRIIAGYGRRRAIVVPVACMKIFGGEYGQPLIFEVTKDTITITQLEKL